LKQKTKKSTKNVNKNIKNKIKQKTMKLSKYVKRDTHQMGAKEQEEE